MKYVYRPTLRNIIVCLGILAFVFGAFYFLEFFYPRFIGLNGLSFLFFGLLAVTEGCLAFYLATKLKSPRPDMLCIKIARGEFALNPIVILCVLSVSAVFPLADRDWLYYLNIGLTAAHIVIRSLVILYFNYLLKRGETALLPIRNHIYIGMSLLFAVLNYYVFAIVKTIGVDMHLLFNGDIAGLTEFFLIMSVVEVAVGIIICMQAMFLSLATYFSGKENAPIDIRTNGAKFKELNEKYRINEILSIGSVFILFMISLMSCISAPEAYLALTVLYFVVLIVRIISYGLRNGIEFSKSPLKTMFREEHWGLFVAAFLVISYSVLSFLYGRKTYEIIGEMDRTLFMTFAIFVPWSIIRLILGIRGYFASRKTGGPLERLNAYLDLLLSLFTLGEALTITARKANLDSFRVVCIAVAIVIGLYCVYIGVKMLVMGVLGLNGKRAVALTRFLASRSDNPAVAKAKGEGETD